jgi:hypothetical protein
MDTVAITIGSSWILTGLLCFLLSLPLIRGQVGRNSFYGARFPESFQSDEAWFAINRHGGKQLAISSIPLVVIGLISFFLPLQSHAGLTLALGFMPIVFILIPALETWRFARRYRSRA